MRGTKAKALRKKVYGDGSKRIRKYEVSPRGQVIADELRFKYQYSKGRKQFWSKMPTMKKGVSNVANTRSFNPNAKRPAGSDEALHRVDSK